MTKYKVQLITSDGRKYPLNVEEDQTILDAALESGLNLPYSCYQPWLVADNYDTTGSKASIPEIPKIKSVKSYDSFHESQDLLDRLLGEEKKGRPVHNTRLSRNRNVVN